MIDAKTIGTLFEKSLESNGSIQPYWLSFRERLNGFDGYEYIEKLKCTIDDYSESI